MPTNYVMVDFENTQPASLDELPVGAFRIMVFVGAAQAKARVSMKFSMSMQRHGANAEYVQMTRSGPNAMDMHIAYFLGQVLAQEPDAAIYIVSKDKDFDPLLEFLDQRRRRCQRVKTIDEILRHAPGVKAPPAKAPPAVKAVPATKASAPRAKTAPTKSVPPRPAAAKNANVRPAPAAPRKPVQGDVDAIDAIAKQLRSMSGKPGTVRKLAQTIDTYFEHHGGARGEKAVEQALAELSSRGFISISGTKVVYTLGS